MEDFVEIYCDGACKGNPGPGGYGAVLLWKGKEKDIKGFSPNTTNNRMELTAAIESISHVNRDIKIKVFSDSMYLKDGITKWIKKWKQNNWIGSDKKQVKNIDLWKQIDELNQKFTIEWHWVKGHNGNEFNERADRLANLAIKESGNAD